MIRRMSVSRWSGKGSGNCIDGPRAAVYASIGVLHDARFPGHDRPPSVTRTGIRRRDGSGAIVRSSLGHVNGSLRP